ncbi:MAG TPA: hypothetical protein VMZ53_05210, partial [Kofleriaceae bacterium]|nr:hypothetical protein [Kofleriaceae bacterium]
HHDGTVSIAGQAPDALVFKRNGHVIGLPQPVAKEPFDVRPATPDNELRARTPESQRGGTAPTPSKFAQTETVVLAKAALTQAGFRAAIAKRAVELACAHVGTNADLTQLIKEALRHCG